MAENNEKVQDNPKSEEARQEALGVLRTSFEMYERTRNDTIKVRRERTDKHGNPMYPKKATEETLELIDTMQEDIIRQYRELGGDLSDLEAIRNKKNEIDRSHIAPILEKAEENDKVKAYVSSIKAKRENRKAKREEKEHTVEKSEENFDIVYDTPEVSEPQNKEVETYAESIVTEIPNAV